jgi:hypothetical protein
MNKVPTQIIQTSSGRNHGNGPNSIMLIIKTSYPKATNFIKFFFSSDMQFRRIDVRVYIAVSNEKTIPTKTGLY